jgi:hypothetical protein
MFRSGDYPVSEVGKKSGGILIIGEKPKIEIPSWNMDHTPLSLLSLIYNFGFNREKFIILIGYSFFRPDDVTQLWTFP